MSWEDQFSTWAQGPSRTEQEKCERAESAVLKAVQASSKLSSRDIRVFAQGSYKNRTNIRLESDVDVCVCCNSPFFYDIPSGMTADQFNLSPATYSYATFKNELEEALQDYFDGNVTRGGKAFDIHANTYRVDADAVPTFQYRRYKLNAQGQYYTENGVKLIPDSGPTIINWPDQNFDNGVAKRSLTGHRYKKIIRILKNLRNKMQTDGISEANNIASFLIECLAWNTPNDRFGNTTLTQDIRQMIISVYNNTKDNAKCVAWNEVNEQKLLFGSGQPWTREQANAFILACWKYLGFKND